MPRTHDTQAKEADLEPGLGWQLPRRLGCDRHGPGNITEKRGSGQSNTERTLQISTLMGPESHNIPCNFTKRHTRCVGMFRSPSSQSLAHIAGRLMATAVAGSFWLLARRKQSGPAYDMFSFRLGDWLPAQRGARQSAHPVATGSHWSTYRVYLCCDLHNMKTHWERSTEYLDALFGSKRPRSLSTARQNSVAWCSRLGSDTYSTWHDSHTSSIAQGSR